MKNPKSPQTPDSGATLYQISSGFPKPTPTPPSPAELISKLTEYATKLTAFELEYRHSQHQTEVRKASVTSLDSLKSSTAIKIKDAAPKGSSESILDDTKIKAFPGGTAALKSEKPSKGE